MNKIPIALQMYTLREETAKDFAGTLRKVSEIGYAGIELAGWAGISNRELSGLLSEYGMSIAGCHVSLDAIEASIQKVIEESQAIGNSTVIVPFLAEERRTDAAAYKKLAELLNGFGETFLSHGISLAYHNHDFEFKPLDNGQIGMDILLDETSPQLVKAEIDTYWVLVAGMDPVEYLAKRRGRVPLVHIKDRDANDGFFAEIGSGNLPIDAIIEEASRGRSRWLVVEQDQCRRDPIESVTMSYNFLKSKGYA